MHYFIHGQAFAAVEDDAQAEKYAEAGWEKATGEQFRAAWRKRDMARLEALRGAQAAVVTAPVKRAPERLPNGMTRFYT